MDITARNLKGLILEQKLHKCVIFVITYGPDDFSNESENAAGPTSRSLLLIAHIDASVASMFAKWYSPSICFHVKFASKSLNTWIFNTARVLKGLILGQKS